MGPGNLQSTLDGRHLTSCSSPPRSGNARAVHNRLCVYSAGEGPERSTPWSRGRTVWNQAGTMREPSRKPARGTLRPGGAVSIRSLAWGTGGPSEKQSSVLTADPSAVIDQAGRSDVASRSRMAGRLAPQLDRPSCTSHPAHHRSAAEPGPCSYSFMPHDEIGTGCRGL